MKKTMILGIFTFMLISCFEHKTKELRNHEIIYTLNKELTESILNKYSKVGDKKDYYIMFNVHHCCLGDDRMIILNRCNDDYKTKKLIKKTNRFLKLEENILLPVISMPDFLYEEETKNILSKTIGQNGSIYFIIDIHNKLKEIR